MMTTATIRNGVLLVAGALAVGCGGRSESLLGPQAVAELEEAGATLAGTTVLSLVSGETGAPVTGAVVRANGGTFLSDAEGRVTLGGVATGTALDVSAEAFLPRETSVPADGRLAMWPDHAGFEALFTQESAYWTGKLIRPDGPLVVVPSPSLTADPEALAVVREAAATASAATAGRIPISVMEREGAPGSVIRLSVNAADPFFAENPQTVAVARFFHVAGTAQGGEIVFRTAEHARSVAVVAHELGHHLGLGHTTLPGMMTAFVDPERRDFSEAEKLVLRLGFLRRPFNAFPDSDRGLSTATATRQMVVVS